MGQNEFLILSVASYIAGIVCAVIFTKVRRRRPKTATLCMFTGTAGAMWLLYLYPARDAIGGPVDAAITAILGTVRAMTGENSLSDTRSNFSNLPEGLEVFFALYTAIIQVTASALILGFLLSLIQTFFPKIKYRFFSRGSLFVFNDLSERALLLAEDISKNNKAKSVFVFLGKPPSEGNEGAEKMARLYAIRGYLFDVKIADLKLRTVFFKHDVDIFLLHMDEKINLQDTLELADKYKDCELKAHINIHILNAQAESKSVVDSIEYNSKLSLRLHNETRSMIYNLFDTKPLFLGARGDNLDILVVGAGRNGMEAIKTAAWCGQTLKLKPRIIVIDADPTAESRFARDCPELALLGAPVDSKEDCSVVFLTADVRSSDFKKMLFDYPHVGYVICALGNEELNLHAAITVRSAYEDIRFSMSSRGNIYPMPIVNVLLENRFHYDIGGRLKFDTKVDCELSPFGNLRSFYTYHNIVSPYLEYAGKATNRFYKRFDNAAKITSVPEAERQSFIDQLNKQADEEYEDKEYNRGSSIALGLHAKYKLYAALCEIGGQQVTAFNFEAHPTESMIEQLEYLLFNSPDSEQNLEKISILEHSRWNAYMRSLGWSGVGTEMADMWFDVLKNHRNFAAKLHPCITTWEMLPKVDAWMLGHGKQVDFQEADRVMVRGTTELLREAEQMRKKAVF